MSDAATRSDASRAQAVLGRTIAGKFLIESYVGGGAMGAVYKARQLALDKYVAIKLLHGEHAGDAMFAARFQREAKAASKLDHPNSMRVLDFGQEPDGLLYIAMEYLDGRDLFSVIRSEWPLEERRVADIVSQALAAIAVAHDMGIVHRDLKPENIMLVSGTSDDGHAQDVVKVCDFGIAKFTDGPERRTTGGGQKLTSQGIVVGTPEYMSPEQGKGEALDARSDLYSMGVILYQMLAGRVPFDAETALGIVLKHVTEDPVPPHEVTPTANARLEAICLKAMRKKREDRYQTAREMRADLRAVLASTDPLGHAPTAQLAPVSAHAPTALAIDSGQVAAATTSKLTPHGTATDLAEGAKEPGRTRVVMVAAGLALVAAGGFAVWRSTAKAPVPATPVLAVSLQSAPVPLPSAPPVHAQSSEEAPPPPTPVASTHATAVAPLPAVPRGTVTAVAAAPVPAPPPAPIPAPPPAPVPAPVPAPPPAPPTVAEPQPVPPPPPAAPPPFDPSHAHVDWSVGGAGGGATPGAVQRALGRSAGAWTQCYRTGLAARHERVGGTGVLHLTTDESGNVVGAQLRGFDGLPGVAACVAASARVHIEGVDTGDAWADIQLIFRPE